jgi:hypothetical protein
MRPIAPKSGHGAVDSAVGSVDTFAYGHDDAAFDRRLAAMSPTGLERFVRGLAIDQAKRGVR